jgi:hypothetical protein
MAVPVHRSPTHVELFYLAKTGQLTLAIVNLPPTLPASARQRLVSALARVLARQAIAEINPPEEPVSVAEEAA